MQLLTNKDSFLHDRHSAGGILAELRKCAAEPGRVARFAIMRHPARNPEGAVRKVIALGFEAAGPDGKPSWRFAGEDGKLCGPGSYALIPTWYPDQSLEHAAADAGMWIGRELEQGEEVFVIEGNALVTE